MAVECWLYFAERKARKIPSPLCHAYAYSSSPTYSRSYVRTTIFRKGVEMLEIGGITHNIFHCPLLTPCSIHDTKPKSLPIPHFPTRSADPRRGVMPYLQRLYAQLRPFQIHQHFCPVLILNVVYTREGKRISPLHGCCYCAPIVEQKFNPEVVSVFVEISQ